ncbi:7263_t:CDS:2, partial [Scutellospora calospora]
MIVNNKQATNGTSNSSDAWTPSSWQTKKIKQNVSYEDQEHLQKVIKNLDHVPPLVTPAEINKLRYQLKQVALSKAFLLQGGDCAELFEYCSQEPIESKLKVLLQMSLVLTWGARIPVVRMAR